MNDTKLATEIRHAIKNKDLNRVIGLLSADPSRLALTTPFGTWLHEAIESHAVDIAKWLIAQGVDVNAVGGIVERSPLDLASGLGNLEIVRALLDAGAQPDVSAPEWNPLWSAIYGGHTNVAKLLISSGIDPLTTYNGMNAFGFAHKWGKTSVLLGSDVLHSTSLGDMFAEGVDFSRLRQLIAAASASTFQQLVATCPEQIYAFCLYTSDSGDGIGWIANTEELYELAAKELLANMSRLEWLASVGIPIETSLRDLRWNPFCWNTIGNIPDSFHDVNNVLAKWSSTNVDVLMYNARVLSSIVLALIDADRDGAFGGIVDRTKLAVFGSVYDSTSAEWFEDDSMARLNSHAVLTSFRAHRCQDVAISEDCLGRKYLLEIRKSL